MAIFGKDKPGPPGGNAQAKEGWYSFEGNERWWTGSFWQNAYRTADGRIDASRCVRQAVMSLSDGDFTSDQKGILRALRQYPPARIVAVTAAPGPIAGRVVPIFVVEWD